MRTVAAAAAVAWACLGCAQIPGAESSLNDTRATVPVQVVSALRPADLAKCVVRNAEEKVGVFAPATVPGVSPEVFEVRIRSDVGIAAVVSIVPRPDGALSSVHVSNHYIGRKDVYAAKLMEGC